MYIAKVKYPYLFNHFDHKDLVAAKDIVYYFNVHGKKHVQFNKGQLIPQVIYDEIFGVEKPVEIVESFIEVVEEENVPVVEETKEEVSEVEEVEEEVVEEIPTEEVQEEASETTEEKKEVKPRKKKSKKK